MPTVCPEDPRMNAYITQHEIHEIIEFLETRHKVKLPVEIRYSQNVDSACCLTPIDATKRTRMSPNDMRKLRESTNISLKWRGLTDSERESIDISKFTIFLSKRCDNPAGMYAAVWEELGHALAWSLFVRDRKLNGNIAVTYRFWGLLKAAADGKLPLENAVAQIETDIKKLEHPLSMLSMHPDSLEAIRTHNPDLTFQGRNSEELLKELGKSIDYAFRVDSHHKSGFEKPLIICLLLIALVLLVLSALL